MARLSQPDPAPVVVRDLKYLAAVRKMPCVLSWGCFYRECKGSVEAAHTGGHGMGQKASDRRAIPLCKGHHTDLKTSYHNLGRRRWEAHYSVEVEAIVEYLTAKPRITFSLNAGTRDAYWTWHGETRYCGTLYMDTVQAVIGAALNTWEYAIREVDWARLGYSA